MSQVDERVCAMAAAVFDVDATTISLASSPADIESWDSLALLNLMVALEDEFSIELPPEDVAEAADLGTIARLVAARVDG